MKELFDQYKKMAEQNHNSTRQLEFKNCRFTIVSIDNQDVKRVIKVDPRGSLSDCTFHDQQKLVISVELI